MNGKNKFSFGGQELPHNIAEWDKKIAKALSGLATRLKKYKEPKTKKGVEKEGLKNEPEINNADLANLCIGGIKVFSKVRNFYSSQEEKIKDIADETKKDIKDKPFLVGQVLGKAMSSFANCVADYDIENKEREMNIRQEIIKNLQDLSAKRRKIDLLDDYKEIQKSEVTDAVNQNITQQKAHISNEETELFKTKTQQVEKQKFDTSDEQVKDFITNLINLLK